MVCDAVRRLSLFRRQMIELVHAAAGSVSEVAFGSEALKGGIPPVFEKGLGIKVAKDFD